jgi:type IV secretory pathway TrbD component
MNPRESISRFFEALEERSGTTLPRPGYDGCVSLAFGNDMEITLEHDGDSPWIHLHAVVGALSEAHTPAPVYRRLLEKNLPGGALRGASLSLDTATNRMILSQSLWIDALTPETFCNAATNFAVTASECHDDLL